MTLGFVMSNEKKTARVEVSEIFVECEYDLLRSVALLAKRSKDYDPDFVAEMSTELLFMHVNQVGDMENRRHIEQLRRKIAS